MSFHGPLFLVGMPRSGTKLLRGLLNEHSQIGIPLNETEFLPRWLRDWASFGDLSDRAVFDRFFADVSGSVYFVNRLEEHGSRIDPAVWHGACRDYTAPAVFEALIRHDAAVSAGVWGDKSPGYLPHIALLKTSFPSARFIHIVRDVRDYCLSMEKAFGKSATRASQRWADRILAARDQATAFPSDYMEVRYEDLVVHPEPALRRLCRFLGLSFEPGMLELSRATENIGDARGEKRIVANIDKWRATMPARRRRRIERIAGDTLDALGYPVSETARRRVTAPEMLALQAYDGAQLIRREADQRGWAAAIRFRLRLFAETGKLIG